LTQTIQPLTWTIEPQSSLANQRFVGEYSPLAKIKKSTETEKNICEALSVCDSLNKLYETLSRLEYIIRRKNNKEGLK